MTDETTTDAGTEMTETGNELFTEILDSLAESARQLWGLYGEVIKRMATDEVAALWKQIASGDERAAKRELRKKMTLQELADEARALSGETIRMVADKAALQAAVSDAAWVILKATLGALVTAAIV